MKTAILCALAMSISVPAEILMPEGKDLPAIPDFKADYLKAETQVSFTYLRPGMSELESIQRWKQSLPPNRYLFDAKTKMLSSREKATIARTDSAGLAIRIQMNGEYDAGAKIYTLVVRGFDSLARRVVEYTFDASQPSAAVDSTRWVWRHSGCADEERDDGMWEWSVDSAGHCREGIYRVTDTAHPGRWVEDHRLLLEWKGNKLSQASEWVGSRKVSREDYVYVGDRVESVRSYNLLEDGGSYLAEKTSVLYSGNDVEERNMEAFDIDGTRYALSFIQPTGTRVAHLGAAVVSGAVQVRPQAGGLRLENPLTESVSLEFRDPSGRILGGVSLEPGQKRVWSAPVGVLLWSARGRGVQVSGRVVVPR